MDDQKQKKIKVAIIYSGKTSYGGIYSFWKNIIDNSPNDIDYTFFSVTEKIPEFKTILKPMNQWLKKTSFRFNFHYYLTGFEMKNYISELMKYDVVIFNQPTAYPVGKILRKKGVRTINILHGSAKGSSDAWKREGRFVYYIYYRLFWFFEKLSGNSCDKVLTVSDFTKQNLIEEGIKKPIINCGFGIETRKYKINMNNAEKKELRKKFGFDDEDYVLLFVGRFDPGKGSDKIISIMKQISSENPRIKLLCVARRPKNYGELISYNISFAQNIPEDKLIKIYNSADLFLFPSRYEGYGGVVAEAIASGLPVIFSDTGLGPDLKSLNLEGIYINPTNEKCKTIISQVTKEYKKRKKYDYSNVEKIELSKVVGKWIKEIKTRFKQR